MFSRQQYFCTAVANFPAVVRGMFADACSFESSRVKSARKHAFHEKFATLFKQDIELQLRSICNFSSRHKLQLFPPALTELTRDKIDQCYTKLFLL